MNIVLKLYIRHVEERDDCTHFLVVPIGPGLDRDVTHNSNGWSCPCTNTTYQTGDIGCEHIYRAWLYQTNMQVRSKQLKQQLRTMIADQKQAKEILDSPIVPLTGTKRKIRLEEE